MITRISVVLALLLAVLYGWAGQQWQLTVLHTNDLHGMMLPHDYLGNLLQGQPRQANVGGLARRATAIAQQRAAIDHTVVVIDCGDTFTRGPWHTRFFGEPEIEALNLMNYDMLCVGNNEFKATETVDSQGIMLGLMRRSRFPWLAANLTEGDTGVPVEGMHPFIIRRYGDVRVGFLGLTAPRAAEYPQTKGWTIGDPIAAAKVWVPLARAECDILLAVTHIGVVLDKQLAAEVPGIDAIIGGDSHDFLRMPVAVKSPDGRDVPIVQAGEMGLCLGRLDLTFEHEQTWRLTKYTGQLLKIDKTYPDNPAMKALLDRYLKPAPVSLWQPVPAPAV